MIRDNWPILILFILTSICLAAIFKKFRNDALLDKENDTLPKKDISDWIEFVIVNDSESKSIPYPFVYVQNNGEVRELKKAERKYLETPFHPADGGRPYTKDKYEYKTIDGNQGGFCKRSSIPSEIEIHPSND